MIHYCYRTTNKINGKFYIGKRTTSRYDNWHDDPYLGSGSALRYAIKKYGEENFHKVILCYAETKEENAANEILFIGEQWRDLDCYNQKPGGDGGCGPHSDETKRKMSKTKIGKKIAPQSEEHRRKIGEGNKGKQRSEETKKKISKSLKGITRTFSEEHRRKLSEAAKAREARRKAVCQ